MPANTVYVGRPTRGGNRFEVGKDGTAAACVRLCEVDHAFAVVSRAAVRPGLGREALGVLVPVGCALPCG